jgi:nucleoside-diphosphate-sugar epimerase
MKNIIITGSNGMIGGLILENCLQRNDVAKVTSITRRSTGIKHPKLVEVIHGDYLNYSAIEENFKNQDVCFFCIGVYTGVVPTDEFKKITVDYTKHFAETLKRLSPQSAFSFLSGEGADQKEKSRILFAREKGKAENILLNLKFRETYIFRPGYIYPVIPRKEPNTAYKIFRVLYKYIFAKITPGMGVASVHLANVMTDIGIHGGNKTIYENSEIRKYLIK